MKKLIAISVVFALVAGAAFAADIGVDVFGFVDLIKGSTNGYHEEQVDGTKKQVKDDAAAGGYMRRLRMQASGENDDGTFGGWLRFNPDWSVSGNPTNGQAVGAWGYAWWKPIEQVRILLGGNPDGFFGADGVTRWNFYQVAGDVGIIDEGWAFGSSFYGAWGGNGLILTITPMEALEINVAIPYMDHQWGDPAKNVYQETHAQVAYNIDGIGKFALTYAGNLGDTIKVKTIEIPNPIDPDNPFEVPVGGEGNGSTLYVYFGLTAIENLGIDIGLGYTLPVKGDEEHGTKGVTYNAPIAAGLGVSFNAGEFGVKARVQGQFAGTLKTDAYEAKEPMVIDFDVLPSYAVSESLTALLSAGLKMNMPDEGDSVIGWHVQPYVTIKSSWWAPNFYAGIRVESSGAKTYGEKGDATNLNWRVPIGIAFSF